MAFDLTYFAPVGGQSTRGKASQHWTYWTLDATATVDSAGYFNGGAAYQGAYNMLEVGDIIHRVTWSTAIGAPAGGTISTFGTHIVNSKSAGVIDVTDTTAGTVTDTD